MSEETIRTALTEHWREEYPPDETMLVPRFIIAAEVIDSDGNEDLRVMSTDGLPPWTAAGLLRGASLITDRHLDEGWESDDE